jgi:ferredoxin
MSGHGDALIPRAGIDALIKALAARGFRVLGPTVRDGAIVYDDVAGIEDLPAGWTDEQDGGRYRLKRRDDDALFGHVVGPHSWKRFLHPPTVELWRARRSDAGLEIAPAPPPAHRLAILGARGCDLHAIAIQDRVLMGGAFVDPGYSARREGLFVVAVNCAVAGGTCFCVSMGTGPKAEKGFDLALTELGEDFLVEVGSKEGRELLAALPCRPAEDEHRVAAEKILARTRGSMGRQMPADELPELLLRNLEHPRWDEVAERCLTCGNCTMVCPTCFCTTVEDVSDLAGEEAVRRRRWDSCFTLDFSYVHGGSVRQSGKSRYRQWMTHKLATWHEQFGSSGCVGCGRCITWCPVGIDITEEVRAIRATEER